MTPTLDYVLRVYGWKRLRRAGLVELLIAMDEAMIAGNESARVACEDAIYCRRG